MKKVLYSLIFIFSFLCFMPIAYATSENYNTSFEITYPDLIDFNNVTLTGTNNSVQYYFDYLSSLGSDDYYIIVAYRMWFNQAYYDNQEMPSNVLNDFYYHNEDTRIYVYLLPKIEGLEPTIKAHGDTRGRMYSYLYFNTDSSHPAYEFTSYQNYDDFVDDIENCINGITCDGANYSTSSYINVDITLRYMYYYNFYSTSYSYSNSENALSYAYNFIYHSDVKLKYTNSTNSGSSYLRKNLFFPQADTLVERDDYFLTYYDVMESSLPQSDIIYNGIGTLFYGSIPSSDIVNFNSTITFKYWSDDYVNNLVSSMNILYFGRVNHNGYYSYEQLNCTADTMRGSLAIDEAHKTANFAILPYGFSCTNNMSDFDYVYLNITFYNSITDSNIFNFTESSSLGTFARLDDDDNSYYGAFIYEKFELLPSSFSILLSTLKDRTTAYYKTDNTLLASVYVNRADNSLGNVILNPISFGYATQTNVLIYDMAYPQYANFTNLDLFIHYDTIISLHENNSYTYYDENNTLKTSDIINNRTLFPDDSYDISYYNNVVSGFIDNISNDITSFSIFLQSAYDTAPDFLQYFIFVVFILICIYFTYRLINRR